MSAYLNTRVSLYGSRLWRDGELDALISIPEAEAVDMLVRRGLPQLQAGFVSLTAPRPDPRSLEQRIIAQVLDETRVMIRPLSGDARTFLSFWTARFEISNVKTLLRRKLMGERPAAVLARLIPMGAFGRLDNQDLAHAEDASELLRRLEAGPYAGIVRNVRRAFEQSRHPFSLDAALDIRFFTGCLRRTGGENAITPACYPCLNIAILVFHFHNRRETDDWYRSVN